MYWPEQQHVSWVTSYSKLSALIAPLPLPDLSDSFVGIQDQLQVTKGKMEQLRRVMEERKARRRARREARSAPYSTSWSVKPNEKSSEETKAAPPESMDIFNAELEPMTA